MKEVTRHLIRLELLEWLESQDMLDSVEDLTTILERFDCRGEDDDDYAWSGGFADNH